MNARLDFLTLDSSGAKSPSSALLCCPRYNPQTDAPPAIVEGVIVLIERGAERLARWAATGLRGAAMTRQ